MTVIFKRLSIDDNVNVVVLQSEGENTFCAGASFDELLKITNFEEGKEFFMGFARLINAMRKSDKIIVGRIQGKAVGGGVGFWLGSGEVSSTSTAKTKSSVSS